MTIRNFFDKSSPRWVPDVAYRCDVRLESEQLSFEINITLQLLTLSHVVCNQTEPEREREHNLAKFLTLLEQIQ